MPEYDPLESLFVHWRLTSACNYDCSGCVTKDSNSNVVYVRERIMRMARRVMEPPRVTRFIMLSGGEPTLHPFLADVTRYFLGFSARSSYVCIETNGSQDIAYYSDLLAGLPKGRLTLSLGLHPACMNFEHLAKILGATLSAGQRAHLRVFSDSTHPGRSAELRGVAQAISSSYGTTWVDMSGDASAATIPLVHGSVPYGPAARPLACGKLVELKGCDADMGAKSPLPLFKPWRHCCSGSAYLGIEPDGYFSGVPCSLITSPAPLWDENIRPFFLRSVACQHERCPYPQYAPPAFNSEAQAGEWLSECGERQKFLAYSLPAVIWTAGEKFSVADLVKVRLHRLKPDGVYGVSAASAPDIIWRHLSCIIPIYEKLNSQRSRDTFLRALRVLETGNGAYLQEIRTSAGKPQAVRELSLADPDEFLNTVACFARQWAAYALEMAFEDGVLRLEAIAPNQEVSEDSGERGRELTVAVICRDNQENIAVTLASILPQIDENMELLLIDNASDDASPAIVARNAAMYPDAMTVITLRRPAPDASCMRMAVEKGKGRNIIFARPGTVLAYYHLAVAVNFITGHDLVFFSSCGSASPEDSREALRMFMEYWGNGGDLAGCVFNVDFLLAKGICASTGNAELSFGMEAFWAAGSLLCLSAPPVYSRVASGTGVDTFQTMADSLAFLRDFLRCHNLPDDFAPRAACERRIFAENANAALQEIKAASAQGKAEDLLGGERLQAIADSRETLHCLLASYAGEYCSRNRIELNAEPEDLDWRSFEERKRPSPTANAYGNADNPASPAPAISIIIANFNKEKYLEACLDSILGQPFQNFELIILDDCSTDGSYDILCDYADLHERIRLYRMASNSHPGSCRNIGMGLARGEYLMFVDSDDRMAPNFLGFAWDKARERNADACVFSIKWEDESGQETRSLLMPNIVLNGAQTLAMYGQGKIEAGAWAKLFKTSLVRSACCRFEPYLLHEECYFMYDFFNVCKTIVCSDVIGYVIVLSENPILRPKRRSYLQVKSAWSVLSEFGRFTGGAFSNGGFRGHARWQIEAMLLPALGAFDIGANDLPLSRSDHEKLRSSGLFVRELLESYAKFHQGGICEKWLPGKERKACLNCCPLRPELVIISPPALVDFGLWLQKCPNIPAMAILVPGQTADCEYFLDKDGRLKIEGDDILLLVPVKSPSTTQNDNSFTVIADGVWLPDAAAMLTAMAALRRMPEADFVCYMQGDESPDPGLYDGSMLLRMQCAPKGDLLRSGACVFRSAFLQENGLQPPRQIEEFPVFMLQVLLKTRKALLAFPLETPGRLEERAMSIPAFLRMAVKISTILEREAPGNGVRAEGLLVKLLRQRDMAARISSADMTIMADVRKIPQLAAALGADICA